LSVTPALTYIVGCATVASSTFTGLSLLYLAKQSRASTEQSKAAIAQNVQSTSQTELMFATSELAFNLDVMIRLDTVLSRVAADPEIHRYVWGETDENTTPQLAGDALLDVLSMALKACDRLPGFAAKNLSDWDEYASYVMAASQRLRERVLEVPEYWPEITPYARRAAEAA
jgi:hypothetical protein